MGFRARSPTLPVHPSNSCVRPPGGSHLAAILIFIHQGAPAQIQQGSNTALPRVLMGATWKSVLPSLRRVRGLGSQEVQVHSAHNQVGAADSALGSLTQGSGLSPAHQPRPWMGLCRGWGCKHSDPEVSEDWGS